MQYRRVRTTSARQGALAAVGVVVLAVGVALLTGLLGVGTKATGGAVRVNENLPVTAMDASGGFANNSPAIVADPSDSRFVVMANRLDAPDFNCALQLSGDHGRTYLPVDPITDLPPGAEKCYAPEVAFGADGTLYYLFVGLQGAGNQPMGAFISTSRDRGRTWNPPQQVLGPENFGVRMAIDPSLGNNGRIHLVWIQAADAPAGGFSPSPNPIMAAYSDDGGRTFSKPVQVSDPARSRVVGPTLTLGPDHAVHIAYYDLGDDAVDYQGLEGDVWQGTWSVVATTSTDGGRTFAPGSVVDDQIRPNERPILIFTMPPPALVADGNRLCAAWTDARTGDADAVLRCSTDAGKTWGGLQRLNDDPAGNGRTQYQPHLGFAPDGRLDAVFYDRRADSANVNNDVYYTYSTNGGRSFAANRRLTSDPSNTTVGQQYTNASATNLVEFGSRIGLLSTDDRAVAAWTDTRNTRFGTAQDVFSTVVAFPSGDAPQPTWARVLGAVLMLAGIACIVLAVGGARRRPDPASDDFAPEAGA